MCYNKFVAGAGRKYICRKVKIDMGRFVHQTSEIGRLNTVMLHRPDVELQSILPDYLAEMLAEDTPYLPAAQREHDVFANTIRANGTEVLYLEDLIRDVLKDDAVKFAYINEYIEIAGIKGEGMREAVRAYLSALDAGGVWNAVCRGVSYRDLEGATGEKPLRLQVTDAYPFITDPIPNAYFTRDICITVGDGMILSCMSMKNRKREALNVKYIVNYHPLFTAQDVPIWYEYGREAEMEGGDVLVLSDKLLAIGCGERTNVSAVEHLAKKLFQNGYERILLFNNPKSRKFMHLDVLCTMVDYDKFLVHPCIADKYFEVYDVTSDGHGGIKARCTTEPVAELFRSALKLPAAQFIEVGGGDPIIASREHWNMGSNSLTLSPGNIITYDRNEVTNELLAQAGIKVNTIPGGELSRGRGGPRCMSMPINRDDVW